MVSCDNNMLLVSKRFYKKCRVRCEQYEWAIIANELIIKQLYSFLLNRISIDAERSVPTKFET